MGYNNIVVYGSNFVFVKHVLSMDTTFPDNALRDSRAILDPHLHQTAYWIIIAAELTVGALCIAGAVRLLANLTASAERFNAANSLAVLDLAGGMLFWFFGFVVMGGEWFQMWQ